ncbi:ALP1-like protein [Tanacetum coccineum]
MKCTSAIRQMAYEAVPDARDEYLQMGATTARKCLRMFCKAIMELYGEEFMRNPTYTDIEKLYAHNEEKHGFPIWHAFFGVSGMNNDVNVLRQSPLFNDLKARKASDIPFVANNMTYKRGYYLTDRIYPQWHVLIKSIKNPGANDHKRILYKTKHEAARKDVEQAFGVLKKEWKLTDCSILIVMEIVLLEIEFVMAFGLGIGDAGPSIEERAILFLEAQDRVKKGPLFKRG